MLVATVLYAERLPIQVYTAADGLAQVTVHAIHRDRRGFLWMAPVRGCRATTDTSSSLTMNADAQAPAANPHVLDATDGTIWAGGDAGLRRITALFEAPNLYACAVSRVNLSSTPNCASIRFSQLASVGVPL